MYKLDEYDRRELIKAEEIIVKIYNYNYVPSSPLTKKLDTILNKIQNLLNEGK